MKINFVFSSDDPGVEMMATAIYSVMENNRKHELIFYVIHSSITADNQARLKKLEAEFDNAKINFIVPDSERFDDVVLTNRKVTMEAYYRYLAPELLPQGEVRALYMDIDMLCRADLGGLYNTNLGDSHIGAVKDWVIMYAEQYADFRKWFLAKNKDSYVNSGLLLMDLNKLRGGVMDTFWKNIHQRSELIPSRFDIFADQTITNITFSGKTKYLNKKYNAYTTALKELGVKEPVIVHFTGSHKPLTYKDEYSTPFDVEYHEYYSKCMNIVGGSVTPLYRKAADVQVRDALADARYEMNIDLNRKLADKDKMLADKDGQLLNKEQEIAMLHRQQRDVRFLAKRLAAETQARLNNRAKGVAAGRHLRYKQDPAINLLLDSGDKNEMLAAVHELDKRNIIRSKVTVKDRLKPVGWRVAAVTLNTGVKAAKKVRRG